MSEHAIYKYAKNGEVIYIGKTDSSLASRINNHKKDPRFLKYGDMDISYFTVKNCAETAVFEKLLINKYQPVLNIMGNYDESIDIEFTEPEWLLYEEDNIDKCIMSQRTSKKEEDTRRYRDPNAQTSVMRLTLRLSEKETSIRRWLELIHENGQCASEYMTIVIKHYLKYKKPLYLGKVKQTYYTSSINTSFLIPEEVVEKLDAVAQQFGNYKRSRIIKSIMNKCIMRRNEYENEEIVDLYSLMDIILFTGSDELEFAEVSEENNSQQNECSIMETEEIDIQEDHSMYKSNNWFLKAFIPDLEEQLADWE